MVLTDFQMFGKHHNVKISWNQSDAEVDRKMLISDPPRKQRKHTNCRHVWANGSEPESGHPKSIQV